VKYIDEYRDGAVAQALSRKIRETLTRPVRLMEICGTHTMAIFRHGIRSLLPEGLDLVSGPGCPVCVTAMEEVDRSVKLARLEGVIVTTFGDMLRVPGSESSLQGEKGRGADVRMVYSTFDALKVAQENPRKEVVFLGNRRRSHTDSLGGQNGQLFGPFRPQAPSPGHECPAFQRGNGD
jgi:hydrogenase expression/formation protein HypD